MRYNISMNKILIFVCVLIVAFGGFYAFNNYIYQEKQGDSPAPSSAVTAVEVVPIMHATALIKWGEQVIYTDPTGGAEAFVGQPAPSIILVTDIHGDHLSTSTLTALAGVGVTLIIPEAVKEKLPTDLASRALVLKNGDTLSELDFTITAIPMYNLPDSTDARHAKGRGNGYVISKNEFDVYVAGDTAGIPEMRALTGIDIALIPMNLPYTMGVEEAADAVLAFKPKEVMPYHYRGQDGLADVAKFKSLVNAGDPNIVVTQLDWYPKK